MHKTRISSGSKSAHSNAVKGSGKKAFVEYYTKQFGAKRWAQLAAAFDAPKQHCVLLNKYYPLQVKELLHEIAQIQCKASNIADVSSFESQLVQVPFLKKLNCIYLPKQPNFEFEQPRKNNDLITNYYLLDAASLLPIEALNVQPSDSILDVCAAPGGKSLAILQLIELIPRSAEFGAATVSAGSLHVNEYDGGRRRRLTAVMQDYLPKHFFPKITITGYDATTPSTFKQQTFDKVLVDAPCSSDRHVWTNAEELNKWTFKSTEQFGEKQFSLLMSALEAVKVGGIVVYATCSMSEMENDKVVERALNNKRGITVVLEKKEFPVGEATKHGWIMLPDKTTWGPLFFAILKRIETPVSDDEDEDDEEEQPVD